MNTIIKLIKLRFSSTKNIIKIFSIILAVLFLASLFINCYILSLDSLDIEYKIVNCFDATYIFILFTLFIVFYRIAFYANNNSYYNVFPTDVKSRYFSNQIINYICIVGGMSLLVLYRLLIRLVCTAFCAISGKAAIVSNYNIGYELYGLLCTILLLLILIEIYNIVITFIQSFGKKGTIIAGIIFILIVALLYTLSIINSSMYSILSITDFYTEENNSLMFVVKLVVTWAIFTFISILVNKIGEYNVTFYNINDTLRLIVKVLYSIGFFWVVVNIAMVSNAEFSPKIKEHVDKSELVTISLKNIDINKLEVKTENFPQYDFHSENSEYIDYGINYIFSYTYNSEDNTILSPFSLDSRYSEEIRKYINDNNLTELKFHYAVPAHSENGIYLTDTTNEKLTFDVVDNTIIIRRKPTKIRSIMIIPTWIFYSNLDSFIDLNVNRNTISSTCSSGSSGYVLVK